MDPSNNPMGGMQGDNNSFLHEPNQPQLSPYGRQAQQGAPQQQQQQQQQPQQLQPSVFTQYSPAQQQQPHQQGGMMYNNQYRQQPQQQQSMMQSTPQYQQQQQASPQPPASGSFAQRSAMMQQQAAGGAYRKPQQQQQPPVSHIKVPNRPQQQPSNTYGGERTPSSPAPGSYSQRYQAMQQQQQTQQQTGMQNGNNQGNVYSQVAGGSDNMYPPSPQRQQQQPTGMMQQQPQQPAPAPGSFAQRQAAMMGQAQNQQQPAPAPGSFAQRQAAMMQGQNTSQGMMSQQQNQQQQFQQPGQQQQQFQQPGQTQQQFQQPGQPQQQQQFQQPGQPQMQQPPQQPGPPQPPQRPMLVDPPEVIAQQQRLLTEATRKVQEHAYYMKQAIDRHDLPTVLERAACMVGELGEHAHSHKSHKLHPPAPGATGTSTALQPKNYYELHLRALEELPTLENYLLDVANTSKQQTQIQPTPQQTPQETPPPQPQQQQQPQPGMVGSPAPVPSSANSAALMQQLTGDMNAGGDNFLNPPQSPAMNPNNPLGAEPPVYSNVMGGNPGMNNNPMMANSQMAMGMGMQNNGMMPPQQMQQQQFQQQYQQPMMMNNTPALPPSPPITYTMMELYDCVQYCPNVLSRLYLQICAASALIRSGEAGARWVFKDLIEAVKCVQNPVRGLFLRHYLLQAFRDKLPDVGIPVEDIGSIIRGTSASAPPSGENTVPAENASTPAPKLSDSTADISETGTVKDAYEFVLANFIEMNKLWVRIQHLPGDQRTKAVRRRREKDRNELRILVGTNLVRLSALDSVTSTIYGQVILPTVLDQIVICADPLSQAYLLDCIIQVFPDEYHIETMPILLAVCPKLRDKVNIRTILHYLMTRLANYLADEELLDEKDSNQVKRAVALDSFRMFNECVQNVYNARGPKLNAKEVIRLQMALLEYSMKCYKGNIEQITLCLQNCVEALQRARDNAAYMMPPQQPQQQYGQPQMPPPPPPTALEPVATKELEKLLSIPLEELALGVLTLDHYSDLIAFLPWNNRRELALNMLESVINTGQSPESVKEIEELFSVIAPVLRGEHDEGPASSAEMDRTTNLMAGLGVSPDQQQQQQQMFTPQQSFNGGGVNPIQFQQDSAMVSKFIGMLDNENTDVLFEMLSIARKHMNAGQSAVQRASSAHAALVYGSLKLARRVHREAHEEPEAPKVASEDDGEKEAVEAEEEPETTTEKDGEEDTSKEEDKVEEDGKPSADVEETPKTPKTIT